MIKVEFFPPNTTSLLQPCDMGIICAVKAIFRKAMCQQVLQQRDESVTTTACKLAKNHCFEWGSANEGSLGRG